MKKIIDGKTYNTDTAELIGKYDNGLGGGDFNSLWEGVYITKKGVYFIAGHGGALSKYSQGNNREKWGGEGMRIVGKEEALQFCEDHGLTDEALAHFSDIIEEG